MSGSTNKRVLVVRFERETVVGFVNPQAWLGAEGIEVLTTGGSVARVPYGEIKAVYFVRDFEQREVRKEHGTFRTRPKMEGLWVRLRLRDGDWMDGMLPNDLLALEAQGFSLIPPDANYQNQRVFVPKAAIAEMRVMGVVGGGGRKRRRGAGVEEQLEMFEPGAERA